MKVIIYLEDTPDGIHHGVKWDTNGITDCVYDSLSIVLAAQFAETLRQNLREGILNITEPS